MSLPTFAELESFLKIQGTADRTLTTALVARATAAIQRRIKRPITAEERTWVMEQPSDALYRTVTRIHVPIYPVAAEDSNTAALTITDADGTELVEDDDYRLNLRTGTLTAVSGGAFTGWPYTIVATVGLSAHPDYASVLEPLLTQAIVDLAAVWYQQRNANATSESEAGVSATYGTDEIPSRICATIDDLKMATP